MNGIALSDGPLNHHLRGALALVMPHDRYIDIDKIEIPDCENVMARKLGRHRKTQEPSPRHVKSPRKRGHKPKKVWLAMPGQTPVLYQTIEQAARVAGLSDEAARMRAWVNSKRQGGHRDGVNLTWEAA